MENKVILKAKKEVKTGAIVVKHGRTIEARIYAPNHFRKDEFLIEESGLAFYRPTLESALEFVRESFESRANAFCVGRYTYTVSISMDN